MPADRRGPATQPGVAKDLSISPGRLAAVVALTALGAGAAWAGLFVGSLESDCLVLRRLCPWRWALVAGNYIAGMLALLAACRVSASFPDVPRHHDASIGGPSPVDCGGVQPNEDMTYYPP